MLHFVEYLARKSPRCLVSKNSDLVMIVMMAFPRYSREVRGHSYSHSNIWYMVNEKAEDAPMFVLGR